jgi:hypothetical protein
MESNFSNRDFEQYVKQNADQYRMFPSDKVWKGVNNTLHTRRKWYGFWLGFLLLLTGGSVTWVMTTHPVLNKQDSATLKSIPASTPGEQKLAPATESARNIESLLPFNKQRFISENFSPVQNDLAIVLPALLSVQDVTEIQIPVTNIQHLSKNGIGSEHSSIVNRITLNNKIVNTTEALFFTDDQQIITETEKSPEIIEHNKSMLKENGFYPLTIESVVNAYQVKKTPKKISWQLFVTPTISYRKLSVNKSTDNPSALNYPFASLSDVNSAVTHKPDIGLQIGLSGRYPITRNLKVRGGFQFNINRYDIKAYIFNGEVATIDLNGGPGNTTISTWTNYRNFNGYKSDWLKNFYFSVSVPIGAELKLFGNASTNVGIAGTVQPTYILSDKAYLISTDFKNYAEVPRLIRHVNLNTSFETFVNYTSGKTNWQIGPQVRYQVLSSFQNKYPVKENLFDFGVKVGVTLNK